MPSPKWTEFAAAFAEELENWSFLARPNQLPPTGEDWFIWLLLAGRGFGKTRSLAEFACAEVNTGAAKRVGLVEPTADDVRNVLVESPSGILACSPPWDRPHYAPSKR